MSDIIKISRSSTIERDRSIAIIRLNNDIKHYIGQPVMVRYYDTKPGHVEVNVILVVGIKEGFGDDCYRIVTAGQPWIVRDVTMRPPDVSMLVHDETYVFLNELDSLWYLAYLPEGSTIRMFEVLEGGPYKFLSIEDNYIWFFKDGIMKKEDDFLTKDEISKLIEETYSEDIEYLKQKVEENTNLIENLTERVDKIEDLFYVLNVEIEPVDEIFLRDLSTEIDLKVRVTKVGEDVTSNCVYSFNSNPVNVSPSGEFTVSNLNISGNYRLIATELGTSKVGIGHVNLRLGYNSYLGVINEPWTFSEASIKLLPYKIPTDYESTTKVSNLSLTNQKTLLAIPTPITHSLEKITDRSSLNYLNSYVKNNLTFSEGINYDIYILDRECYIDQFDQECFFEKIPSTSAFSEFTKEFNFEFN